MVEQGILNPGADRPERTSWRGRLTRYGPLIFWAVLIFIGSGSLLSAEHTSIIIRAIKRLFPSASPDFLSWFHFLFRKAGHLTEYAILAILGVRALRNSSHPFIQRHRYTVSLLLAVAYALTDEFHQSFVPSRTATIHDSMIDAAGAIMALGILWYSHRKRRTLRQMAAVRSLEH